MSTHYDTVVDERRSWTRFPKERGTETAVIMHPQCGEMLADVHDESLGGIGLFMDDDAVECFFLGQEVDIVYAGDFFRACVRHVQPHETQGYIVGFSREQKSHCP